MFSIKVRAVGCTSHVKICGVWERCFSSCHERGTNKKVLSPHEESNLRPSDSALRCSTTEPQRLYGGYTSLTVESMWLSGRALEPKVWGSIPDFSLSHARDKTKNIFLSSLPSSKLTISTISIYVESYSQEPPAEFFCLMMDFKRQNITKNEFFQCQIIDFFCKMWNKSGLSVNTKTVDSVEGALWLATQTPNTFVIHFRATCAEFGSETIVTTVGMSALSCHCFSTY